MMAQALVFLAMAALLFVLGVIFWFGKGAWMIAGYNTMPKAQRDRFDKKALCRFMAKVMFALAGTWTINAIAQLVGSDLLYSVGMTLFFGVIVFTLIYTNTKNRFRR